MKKIKNEMIQVNGILADRDLRVYSIPFSVIITNDDYGCILSINSDNLKFRYTIPLDPVLEVLGIER